MKILNEEKVAFIAFIVSVTLISFILYFAAGVC